jgi:hypothetical protein
MKKMMCSFAVVLATLTTGNMVHSATLNPAACATGIIGGTQLGFLIGAIFAPFTAGLSLLGGTLAGLTTGAAIACP